MPIGLATWRTTHEPLRMLIRPGAPQLELQKGLERDPKLVSLSGQLTGLPENFLGRQSSDYYCRQLIVCHSWNLTGRTRGPDNLRSPPKSLIHFNLKYRSEKIFPFGSSRG